jgi:hypothetical protein
MSPDAAPEPVPPPDLTLLQRREIEARIVGPLLRAMEAEFGRERTLAVVRGVITDLAHRAGADLARQLGDLSLEAFAACLPTWNAGGALEMEVLERSPTALAFNVTRCRYAEMYRALGLADLGFALSCSRDGALAGGFNPAIRLARSQTIMEGAPFCDFRFRMGEGDGDGDGDDPSDPGRASA